MGFRMNEIRRGMPLSYDNEITGREFRMNEIRRGMPRSYDNEITGRGFLAATMIEVVTLAPFRFPRLGREPLLRRVLFARRAFAIVPLHGGPRR